MVQEGIDKLSVPKPQTMNHDKPIILYLIRHAQTAWHNTFRCAGQTDVTLSEHGLDQSEKLKMFFRDRELGMIVGSDLKRARLTAEPLCRERGLDYHENPALREIHWGVLEGTDGREWSREYPDLMKRWPFSFEDSPPGGESRKDLVARTSKAIESLTSIESGPIAVFSHAGAIKAILSYLILSSQNLPVDRILRIFGFAHASVTTLRYREHTWHIDQVNLPTNME